jgi:hypothetical protein
MLLPKPVAATWSSRASNAIPRVLLPDTTGPTSGLSAVLSRPELTHDRNTVIACDVALSRSTSNLARAARRVSVLWTKPGRLDCPHGERFGPRRTPGAPWYRTVVISMRTTERTSPVAAVEAHCVADRGMLDFRARTVGSSEREVRGSL